MTKSGLRSIAFCLMLAVVSAAQAGGPAPSVPIRSRAQLEAWLQANAGKPTPLDRMPAGARMRFLASLRFGETGLGGFDTADLGATLAADDIRAVLALFGHEAAGYAAHIRSTRLPAGHDQTRQGGNIGAIEQRFDELYLFEQALGGSDTERAAALSSRYRALFPAASDAAFLAGASDPELKLLFRAAAMAGSGAADALAADAMDATIVAMDERGISTPAELETTRNALLGARRFDSATRLADAHPAAGLAPLPAIEAGEPGAFAGTPTLWRLDDAGARLARAPIDTAPLQVLVLAGCHFSADAARDVGADPLLAPVFRTHAHWLALPPGQEDLQAVREWNLAHPRAPMEMLYDRADWPMFARWTMPTFYVMRDGRVLGSVSGWARDGSSKPALVALLRRTGLLPAVEASAPAPGQGAASSSR
jgi:hypothetical protein